MQTQHFIALHFSVHKKTRFVDEMVIFFSLSTKRYLLVDRSASLIGPSTKMRVFVDRLLDFYICSTSGWSSMPNFAFTESMMRHSRPIISSGYASPV